MAEILNPTLDKKVAPGTARLTVKVEEKRPVIRPPFDVGYLRRGYDHVASAPPLPPLPETREGANKRWKPKKNAGR